MSKPQKQTRADDLTLYMFPSCPFCHKVTWTLDQLGVDVEYRNIHEDDSHREELVEARGQPTVPVLRIASSDPDEPDEWMPESSDIEQYLADRFGDGTVPPKTLSFYLTDWRVLAVIAGLALALATTLL